MDQSERSFFFFIFFDEISPWIPSLFFLSFFSFPHSSKPSFASWFPFWEKNKSRHQIKSKMKSSNQMNNNLIEYNALANELVLIIA